MIFSGKNVQSKPFLRAVRMSSEVEIENFPTRTFSISDAVKMSGE